jgi:hypothetical protein
VAVMLFAAVRLLPTLTLPDVSNARLVVEEEAFWMLVVWSVATIT